VAARTLANQPVDVVVIDRNNYHTFRGASLSGSRSGLTAEDIAYPVGSVF